ncbi:MAG: ABC transporter permease subunit [Oscillospiraceae bacterium]|nr:ABC transporter permease subunit [Oscillospiraceae bacterium]
MSAIGAEKGAKIKRKRVPMLRDIMRNPFSYALALPAMAYVFIFNYLTLPYIMMAFQKYNYRTGLFRSEFIGFKNFEFFFASARAGLVTFNTIFLNILFLSSGTFVAVSLALLLNEVRSKVYLRINQASLLFPNFISWVIVSYIAYAFFSQRYGWLNTILQSFGAEPVNMYTNASYWPPVLTIIRLWKGMGMSSVIYMATITGFDEGLYEAARIDGATRLQQTFFITLPLLTPTICILTLLSIGRIFYGDFQMIYALVGDNGILMETTDVIDTYVFRALRQTGDPANAMAVGLYQALVGFLMVFFSNHLVRKLFPDGAIF